MTTHTTHTVEIAEMTLRKRFHSHHLGNGTPISVALLNAQSSGRIEELDNMINEWVSSICTDEFLNREWSDFFDQNAGA